MVFTGWLLISGSLLARQDTLVVTDYGNVLLSTKEDSTLTPITSLSGITQAGFFLVGKPNGQIRICTKKETYVWVEGRLLDRVKGCAYYNPDSFLRLGQKDTVYISFSSDSGLKGLVCEQIVFDNGLVVKDDLTNPRSVRDAFAEFSILALVILCFLIGLIVIANPTRLAYIRQKTFTFKTSTYEFINTGFFSNASINLLIFYATSLGFVGTYLNKLLELGLLFDPNNLFDFFIAWFSLSAIIFLFLVAKWLLLSLVSMLFRFRSLKDFQMFDFLNFNLVVMIFILAFIIIDFIFNPSSLTWISGSFLLIFPLSITLFVIWFTMKFVTNSPRKKLVIISYLCATEIVPVIVLLGNFYK